jgi:hypothetical protein
MRHGLGLHRRYVAVARMGSGDKIPQDLTPIVEEALPIFRQSRPDIAIAFHAAESLPPVRIDRDAAFTKAKSAEGLEKAKLIAAALEKLDAGAALVQLYSGLIYAGPGLVKELQGRERERG